MLSSQVRRSVPVCGSGAMWHCQLENQDEKILLLNKLNAPYEDTCSSNTSHKYLDIHLPLPAVFEHLKNVLTLFFATLLTWL